MKQDDGSNELLASLDAWIDDALRGSKPIGLTLCRARTTIIEQRARIGEILSALERQNRAVEMLRNLIQTNNQQETK